MFRALFKSMLAVVLEIVLVPKSHKYLLFMQNTIDCQVHIFFRVTRYSSHLSKVFTK